MMTSTQYIKKKITFFAKNFRHSSSLLYKLKYIHNDTFALLNIRFTSFQKSALETQCILHLDNKKYWTTD